MTPSDRSASDLSVSATERETGVSREVLRKWELRYGFPNPTRDAKGERHYPSEQVERIKVIKRLLDTGMRPSKVVPLKLEELGDLTLQDSLAPLGNSTSEEVVEFLRLHDINGLKKMLRLALAERGLSHVVLDTIASANHAVGNAWFQNILQVHEEHLYSGIIQELLREAIAHMSQTEGSPRVLLATPPNELHGLGILMVQALFSLHGAYCIELGPQTPLFELQTAAKAHQADIVALSFSVSYPKRQIAPFLAELRSSLAPSVAIWIGGDGTRQVKIPVGVTRFLSLQPAVEALKNFRS